MNLQGRILRPSMTGADVTLLQKELRQLNHNIPTAETVFGDATRVAVLAVQRVAHLPLTGVVDDTTAAAINRLVDHLQRRGTIAGVVKGDSTGPVAGVRVEVAGANVSVMTNAQGEYQLSNLPAGQLVVVATHIGYKPQKASVSVAGGRTVVHDFTLQPLATQPWTVSGRVLKDGKPLVGVKLVALQKVGVESERVGEDVSQEDGEYDIHYTPRSTPVTLRVKAFSPSGEEIGDSGIRENVTNAQAGVDIVLATPGQTARVVGGVVRADGAAVTDADITIESQGLRKLVTLGTATTDRHGRFVFEYQQSPSTGDLCVTLVADAANGIKESQSRILAGAAREERVDFVVNNERYRGPSTFERVQNVVAPILGAEGIALTDLADFDDHETAALLSKAGTDPGDLVLLKQAAALNKETGIAPEILYGLGRQKLPLSLPALLAQDPGKRRAAVESALARNDIPPRLEKDARAALTKLKELSVAEALKKPAAADATSLAALLDTAGLAEAKQQTFVNAYANHTGSIEKFWDDTRKSGDLTGAEVDAVQFTLQLAAVTHNHAPMVKALKERGVATLQDLAKLDKTDWVSLITRDGGAAPIGVPLDLKAAGATDEDYADIVFKAVEDAFPSALVAHRIDKFHDPQPLATFFKENPDFDLRTTPLGDYLANKADALDFAGTAEQKARLAKRLKGIQRTYRVAPRGARVETIQALLSDGVDSAQKIRSMGRAAFVRRYEKALGGPIEAERTYAKAHHASALAATLLARHSAAFDTTPIHVLPKRLEKLKTFDGYQTLFGSLDFCACEHCRSVYSPAAYLVDVLHWLYNRPSQQAGKTLLHAFFDNRRGDIGTIELSCKNTNTPLPYIDIINEVLELAVAGNAPPSVPAMSPSVWQPAGAAQPAATTGYQTTGSPEDLLVHPEHLHAGAYEVLAGAKAAAGRDAVYPFNLPFNLWLEESRSYLGQLGVARHRLMELLHRDGREAALADTAVAAEALGLSNLEWQIIAGDALNPARTSAAYWGLTGDANWVDKLKTVSVFLERATPPLADHGMQFEELAELLRSGFMQNPKPVDVWFNKMTCDTTTATLVDLSSAWLDRAHRFIRLQRRIGWTPQDLDLAIQILGGGTGLRDGTLTSAFLIKLSHVRRLREELQVPLPEMLSWWGQLDTRRWKPRLDRGRPATIPAGTAGFGMIYGDKLDPQPNESEDESFYDRIFQNRSVTAEDSKVFGVAEGGGKLVDETKDIDDHVATVVGALGITAEELAKLVTRLPNAKLTLANLSALYRHVSLARALGLSVDQLVSLLGLTGINPFDPAQTANTIRFVEEVNAVRKSGSTVEELDYLLRHVDTKPATLEPELTSIAVVLKELRDDLVRVRTENTLPDDTTPVDELRTLLEQKLALAVPAGQLAMALTIVDGQPGAPRPPDAEQQVFIEAWFGEFLDPADAKTKLVGAAQLADRRERLVYVLEGLLSHLQRTGTDNAVIQKIADSVALEPGLAAALLRDYVRHPSGGATTALEVFRDVVDFVPSDDRPLPNEDDLPRQFATFKRLHKIAMIVGRFRIRLDELAWVFRYGPQQGTLDFDTLQPAVAAGAPARYVAWSRLRDAIALRDTLTTGTLLDLFEGAASFTAVGDNAAVTAANEALLGALEKRTRWNAADLRFLVGDDGFKLTFPDSWKDERALRRLAEAMAAVRRIGLPAEQLWSWKTIPTLDRTADQRAQAEDIKQAVRSRYQPTEWRTVARSLRDRLREQQRNGLVGWLLGNPQAWGTATSPWRAGANAPRPDANDVFSHFLLDVEMSPCQPTSRIKQAMSSTQLFIQRAFMNLEPDAILSPDDAREWKWMKNYRVWEANRKVFLYPENWIDPELRDDKTPFFKEFENKLLRDDVTDASAEEAFRTYLEDLDEVARLEVVGVYREEEFVRIEDAGRIPPVDMLHVFGRTRSTPPIYYYRRRVDSAYWTPWEKVEVDIEGDHLLPVVFNRRMYLFWAQIMETALEEVLDKQDKPKRYYQIRLAWSERRNGKWSKKKLSSMQIGGEPNDYDRLSPGLHKSESSQRSDFFFRSYEDAGDLIIEPTRCYRDPAGQAADTYIRLDRFRLSGCDGTLTLEENPGTEIKGQRVLYGPEAGILYRTTNPVTGQEYWPNGRKAYFFKGDKYIRYDVDSHEVDRGPKKIVGNWARWPVSFAPIDAAVEFPVGRAYFFKGDQYLRFNMWSDEVDVQPRSIVSHWSGWPESFLPIDAAVNWGNGKVYFFKGDEYIRFDIGDDQIDQLPKKIVGNWAGWPPTFYPIDAAVAWPNGKAYFFKGDKYIRFDIGQHKVDKGPTNVLGNWGKWPSSFITEETVGADVVAQEVTVRRPDDTTTQNQSFARTVVDGGLTLPAENPTNGTLSDQDTLGKAPSPFSIVPLKVDDFRSISPFFFQDLKRTFFVEPSDAYRWVRQKPTWTIPGAIPVDIQRVLPELGPTPKVPSTDPWAYVAGATVVNPSRIETVVSKGDFLELAGGTRAASGLIYSGLKQLGEVLGPQLAYMAADSLTARASNKIALGATAKIYDASGMELAFVRSAIAPTDDSVQRAIMINTSYRLPPSEVQAVHTGAMLQQWDSKQYRFDTFYHPYLCAMMRQLNRFGIDGLLDPRPDHALRRQNLENDYFQSTYAPIAVAQPFPRDNFDFSYPGAYSIYNWELFFHAPFSIAVHLTRNRRFEDAHRWFHYIFDPTESSPEDAPQRFWKVRPLFELFYGDKVEAGPIHELFLLLQDTSTDPARVRAREALVEQVNQWRKNPFNPHAIARLRLAAYQKAVVMKYLDNLIEWGDDLFRRDTMESINEATQLYVLGAQILGRRPQVIPVEDPKPRTFNDLLVQGLDEFSNAAVEEVEGYLPETPDAFSDSTGEDVPVVGPSLFFAIPPNEKLLRDYWDRVADRLFKIRHCMNIEGVVRQLPLFEPPIDPALLVRAAALGLDLSSALSDLNAPLPWHRYRVLSRTAIELCADVRALASALLSALEKKDAEALALLRASHDSKLQSAIRQVREQQIQEAKETLEGLNRTKENAQLRMQYYRSRPFMTRGEKSHVALSVTAGLMDAQANTANTIGSILGLIPDFDAGASGISSPVVKARIGGTNLAAMMRAIAEGFRGTASALDRAGQLASILAGYQRRADDWRLQGDVAEKEIQALDRQILGAEIRVAIAEMELENVKLQVEHSEEAETFLRDKYTNEQLYQWMVGQASSLYFQSYKLAVDLAKRSERAWQFEMAAPEKSFIQFGYWDSLKRGLLAGERLQYDLKRMEAAYLEGQRREYELTRHVSLQLLDPIALARLREEGECFVRIPEAWFDIDTPGHYLRRIKSVAVTIPSVTGPYVPVRCTLTLMRSEVRTSAAHAGPYARAGGDDARFRDDPVGLQSIVTSRAQEDSGLFETNLADERYLPFEGAGVISEWRIQLPKQFPQFDYSTISDVIFHIRYTARDGGDLLRNAAVGELQATLNNVVLAEARKGLSAHFSFKHEFPSEWHRFLNPQDTEKAHSFTADLSGERFPFVFSQKTIKLNALDVFFELKPGVTYDDLAPLSVDITERRQGGAAYPAKALKVAGSPIAALPHAQAFSGGNKDLGKWSFEVARDGVPDALRLKKDGADDVVVIDNQNMFRLNPDVLNDVLVAVRFSIS